MTDTPTTPATATLDQAGIAYRLVHHGRVASAEEAAERRGIELGALAKTLVIRLGDGEYTLVLVPGDRALDYPKLRQHLGVRRLTMPSPAEAQEATGYTRGTITPLGAGDWPVVIDTQLMAHPEISLGSGVGDWAIHMSPDDLVKVTRGVVANVTSSKEPTAT